MRKRALGEIRVIVTGEPFGYRAEVWTGSEWLKLPFCRSISVLTEDCGRTAVATLQIVANLPSEP